MENARQIDRRQTNTGKVYKVYSIVEKPGNEKNIWLDIGIGWLNRDESITCKLNCFPINGVLQLRLYDGRKSGGTQNSYPAKRNGNEGGFQQ